MRYHSNPKPVRIRFESGGEEHFSLDSLLVCFNPFDIINKKSELLRWLSTQKSEDAKRIIQDLEQIDFCEKNAYLLYRTFFKEYIDEKDIKSIIDLLLSWKNEASYNDNYELLKQFCYTDSESLTILCDDPQSKFMEEDWFPVIEKYVLAHYIVQDERGLSCKKVVDQPLLLYKLGVLMMNKDNYADAETYLEFAKQHGVKQAAKTLKAMEKLESANGFQRLPKDFDWKLVQSIIQYCTANFYRHWGFPSDMIKSFWKKSASKEKELSSEETEFVEFAFSCCALSYYPSISDKYYHAKDELVANTNDILRNEKLFVVNLIGSQCYEYDNDNFRGHCKKNLEAMNYIPAQYVAKKINNDYLDSMEFRTSDLSQQIKVFLNSIFLFRKR